jgi:hypothetical protein
MIVSVKNHQVASDQEVFVNFEGFLRIILINCRFFRKICFFYELGQLVVDAALIIDSI